MKCSAFLFVILSIFGSSLVAHSATVKRTQSLVFSENGKLTDQFAAYCNYLSDEANHKLQSITKLDVQFASAQVYEDVHRLRCGGIPEHYCGKIISRICEVNVSVNGPRFSLEKTQSEKRKLNGEDSKIVCGADLASTTQNPNTVVARIKETGLFGQSCRVESITLVIEPIL